MIRQAAVPGFLRLGALLWCLAAGVAAAADSDAARAWLERMGETLANQNYDGRFIHSSASQAETLRIVHRIKNGKVTERLVSLDGSGREYIRTNVEVICYMPDKRTVLVETRSDSDALLSLIPAYRAGLEAYYDIAMGPLIKILGRKTQVISVQPRDDYRYGYRLWLDAESAMPLKSQLFDRSGRVIEQIAFAELEIKDSIPDSELQSSVDTTGFEWIRHEFRKRTISKESLGWRVQNLPPGFELKVTRVQPVAGTDKPVRHLVYSDGLASVSIFIEEQPRQAAQQPRSGYQRVGSASAFFSDAPGYQVTGVGEVPMATVQRMVTSLVYDPKK